MRGPGPDGGGQAAGTGVPASVELGYTTGYIETKERGGSGRRVEGAVHRLDGHDHARGSVHHDTVPAVGRDEAVADEKHGRRDGLRVRKWCVWLDCWSGCCRYHDAARCLEDEDDVGQTERTYDTAADANTSRVWAETALCWYRPADSMDLSRRGYIFRELSMGL